MRKREKEKKTTLFCQRTMLAAALACCSSLSAQNEGAWTLRNAIDYAIANNIDIKTYEMSRNSAEADYEQAKAQRLPDLTFGASETLSHFNNYSQEKGGYESDHSFTEHYSLSSSMTLFSGLKLRNNIKQQNLRLQISDLAVEEAKQNIELAITNSYLQILYAKDNVTVAELSLATSTAQAEQGELKYKAGSISEADYAKLQSQKSNDEYKLVTAKNALASRILDFKQLLELGIDENPELYYPEIDDNDVLTLLPTKEEVFNTAMSFMPQIKSGETAVSSAEYELKKARGDRFPALSLSAGISTGHSSADKEKYYSQLNHNFSQNIGLTLNYKIFNRKETRTNIAKAGYDVETAKLNAKADEKDLLKTVEDVYLNVVSSQNRFIAAKEALRSAEISYKLMEDKFNIGLKNIYEYVEEKNNYLDSKQEFLQAKYETILNQKLLDFYQNKPITL